MTTLLLNKKQIEHRINRIAYQIYEDNFEVDELIIAGVPGSGIVFATRIKESLQKICNIKIKLIEINIDKHNQLDQDVTIPLTMNELKDNVVILVDDVLNSGKTLTYATLPFLKANVRKIRTVLMVDRDHKRYPINADYVGFQLSTTLKEHVTVDLTLGNESVTLS